MMAPSVKAVRLIREDFPNGGGNGNDDGSCLISGELLSEILKYGSFVDLTNNRLILVSEELPSSLLTKIEKVLIKEHRNVGSHSHKS